MLADGDEIATCVIANDEKVEGYADAPWQIDSDEVILETLSILTLSIFQDILVAHWESH